MHPDAVNDGPKLRQQAVFVSVSVAVWMGDGIHCLSSVYRRVQWLSPGVCCLSTARILEEPDDRPLKVSFTSTRIRPCRVQVNAWLSNEQEKRRPFPELAGSWSSLLDPN